MGGSGKSTLAAKLVQRIIPFEVVVWRSLKNAPTLEEWLETVLHDLLRAQGKDIALPSRLDGKLQKLIESLRQKRCLLIVAHYGGNPLALKLVAATTQELFNGRIVEVLNYVQQGLAVFEDIRDLLQQQFDRLSEIEIEMIFWLAINREPISMNELSEDIATVASRRRLPDAMQSLLRRSLIEKEGERFSLQPMMLEYVTDQLVQGIAEEIATQKPARLKTHTLIKAQAKDYIREMQERLIGMPIVEQLLIQFGNPRVIEQQLKAMLEKQQAPQSN